MNQNNTEMIDKPSADPALTAAAGYLLLDDIREGGLYLAELPKIVEGQKLRVEVDIWDAYGTEGSETTVKLTTGTLKNRFLYDEELEGAKFYKDTIEHRQP